MNIHGKARIFFILVITILFLFIYSVCEEKVISYVVKLKLEPYKPKVNSETSNPASLRLVRRLAGSGLMHKVSRVPPPHDDSDWSASWTDNVTKERISEQPATNSQ